MAWIKQEMGYKGRLLAPLQRLDPLNKGDPNQNYWILQLISLINPNPLSYYLSVKHLAPFIQEALVQNWKKEVFSSHF